MFLHLGGNYMVKKNTIIAILNLETLDRNKDRKKLLSDLQKKQSIIRIFEEGKEKSFVITTEKGYLSPISSYILLKRSKDVFSVEADE